MNGIPVKYNDIVVGWTDAENNCIKFNETYEAQQIQLELLRGEPISISSRAIGEVDEKGRVKKKEYFESVIIKDKDLVNYERCIGNTHEGTIRE